MSNMVPSQPSSLAIASGILFFGAYVFYRWLLPKPITGIPYNTKATKSIFGDLPDMLEHLKHSKAVTDWMEGHNHRHNSPIVQVFFYLFQKPVVIINDFKEAQDILMRRGKEFDKPDMISDLLYGLAREHHSTLKSNDDRFKSQRKWLQDLMSQSFLHGVTGPHLHKTFMELIQLWQEKMRLSGPEHHPFLVKPDITHSALEAIWAAMFGTGETATITMRQIDLLSSLKPESIQVHPDGALDIPEADRAPTFDAILRLTDTFEGVLKSPFPRIYGWFLPYRFANLVKLKNNLIIDEIRKAERRMHDINGEQGKVFNAVDHMLHRESQQAAKEGKKPQYYSKPMIAEIFGLLVAGHDTTSTTLMWSLKWLAGHPTVQSKLRTELRDAYSAAFAEGRVPTSHEITTTPVHYLDASIEELVRCSQTAAITSRTSTTNAVVLGHVIPKGTRVIMLGQSAGILKPSHNIPDSLRSPTYHSAGGGKIGAWDETSAEEMAAFKPDRWLKTEADGSKVFDATLGPHLGFGAGPRGCFGRKLAYLELRLAIVLILWHFELQKVPDNLDSYEPIEQLTHNPIQCYVRLAPAP
ncbi:cytochrome P450 [Macroventuria anomochaeta]|uniref:Cytochrome P450 n=1 Tax=Macroventuria anomochaeta TaxID=301207 RepID=A0ACB6RM60_9PLEO|nr:cytochrome P450 [Macroventuria anomochaeta]KAF2622802.1 cytochrome P450 [Macroventuria anomochaeta]